MQENQLTESSPTETIKQVCQLRFSNRHLQQELEIERKWIEDGVEQSEIVREWHPVREVHAPPVIDWKNLDWDKKNGPLAEELGVSKGYISIMRSRYGHKSAPKGFYGVDLKTFNWNRTNGQIAAEVGVEANNIRSVRVLAGVKPFERPESSFKSYRKVTKAQIAAADWTNRRDIDLAKEWGVTRERVRQMRQKLKKPACIYHQVGALTYHIMKWMEEHKHEFNGKCAGEIARMIPIKSDLQTRRNAMRRSGIEFDWITTYKPTENHQCYILNRTDWRLPNAVLSAIWDMPRHAFGNVRSNKMAPKAKWNWKGVGFGAKSFDWSGLEAAVKAEIEKAKSMGAVVKEEAVWDYINARRLAVKPSVIS